MPAFQILHNPQCSKSRACLQLLNEHGVVPDVRLYLESPLSYQELRALHVALGGSVREMLRTEDSAVRVTGLADPGLTDEQLLHGIAKAPALLQRPIVIVGDRALVCRPPERVVSLL